MPRPTRSQGRPGTPVIPADWQASHRPVAERTMTATGALHRPGTRQVWDAPTEQNRAMPLPAYWTGPARVQVLGADRSHNVIVADDPAATAGYLITLPADTEPAEGHLITLTGTGDSALDDHTMTVVQVTHGSLRFERDIVATLNA